MNDILSSEKLIIQYLEFLIAEDFHTSCDLSDEIIFTENIMSGKIMIVQNFSEQISHDVILKNYLEIIIININLKLITVEDMHRTLRN